MEFILENIKQMIFFDTNILGTYNVLKQAVKSVIKRVIHISSTSVYGISKKQFRENHLCKRIHKT